MARLFGNRQRLSRLVYTALALALVLLVAMLIQPWLALRIPPRGPPAGDRRVPYRVGNHLCRHAGERGDWHGGVRGFALLGTTQGASSAPASRRGFFLCGSCLVALVLAELIVAAWRASLHRPHAPRRIPELDVRFPEPSRPIKSAWRSLANPAPSGSLSSRGSRSGKSSPGSSSRRYPATVRVELVAELADTLAGQYRKLAGLRRRPGVLIVYSRPKRIRGSPRAASRALLPRRYALALLGPMRAAGPFSPLCALIRKAADEYRVTVVRLNESHPPLVDVPAYTPAEFAARLDDISATWTRSLSTVNGSVRDGSGRPSLQ